MAEGFANTTIGPPGASTPTILNGTAGEALSQYDLVYADLTDGGKFKKAQCDGTSEQAEVWGIAIESGGIADDAEGQILLSGSITNPSWSWTPKAVLWLGTDGLMTETKPTIIDQYAVPVAKVDTATTIIFRVETGWQV